MIKISSVVLLMCELFIVSKSASIETRLQFPVKIPMIKDIVNEACRPIFSPIFHIPCEATYHGKCVDNKCKLPGDEQTTAKPEVTNKPEEPTKCPDNCSKHGCFHDFWTGPVHAVCEEKGCVCRPKLSNPTAKPEVTDKPEETTKCPDNCSHHGCFHDFWTGPVQAVCEEKGCVCRPKLSKSK